MPLYNQGYGNQNMYNGTQFQQPQQQTGFITTLIHDESEVNVYPVAAGNTVLLMKFEGGKFWLKSTAPNGIPQPIREFTFVEEKTAQPAPLQNGNYVTVDEFNKLSTKLDKLLEELGGSNDKQ